MDCKYNVYINTMAEETVNQSLQHDCESLTTSDNYRKECPIMDIIPYEFPPNYASSGNRHVVMIDIPEVENVDFISDNQFNDPSELTSKRYPGKKAFMSSFKITTGSVTVKCYGKDKKVILDFKIYFLRQEGVGWRCGTELIEKPGERLYEIAYCNGSVNFIFNPWEAESSHAYLLVNGMPVEYARSDGEANMISLRNPSINSVSLLLQLKNGKVVSVMKQNAPRPSGGPFMTY